MNPRLMVESPDPYQSKKFKIIFKENSFLSSRVRGRVIESGSGSVRRSKKGSMARTNRSSEKERNVNFFSL